MEASTAETNVEMFNAWAPPPKDVFTPALLKTTRDISPHNIEKYAQAVQYNTAMTGVADDAVLTKRSRGGLTCPNTVTTQQRTSVIAAKMHTNPRPCDT